VLRWLGRQPRSAAALLPLHARCSGSNACAPRPEGGSRQRTRGSRGLAGPRAAHAERTRGRLREEASPAGRRDAAGEAGGGGRGRLHRGISSDGLAPGRWPPAGGLGTPRGDVRFPSIELTRGASRPYRPRVTAPFSPTPPRSDEPRADGLPHRGRGNGHVLSRLSPRRVTSSYLSSATSRRSLRHDRLQPRAGGLGADLGAVRCSPTSTGAPVVLCAVILYPSAAS